MLLIASACTNVGKAAVSPLQMVPLASTCAAGTSPARIRCGSLEYPPQSGGWRPWSKGAEEGASARGGSGKSLRPRVRADRG
jgi:hypothetical protein